MSSITIITIVVVAVVTMAIFGFAWLGYSSCLKKYKMELETGKHDIDLCNERYNNKNKKVVAKAISYAMSIILLIIVLGFFVIGIVFASNNESLSFGGKNALVIKSGSMSSFYDDKLEQKYENLGYNKNLQFNVGDICIFEKTESLVIGEVYAYQYKNVIITHRLVGTQDVFDQDGNLVKTYYIFRGDNNPSQDQVLISADKILYHYTDKKIPAVGSFILYAKSYIGIWALLSVMGVIIISDIVLRKIQKLNTERFSKLGGAINE